VFGADGAFDIWDFAGLLLYYEGSTFSDAYFREGAVRAFYGWSSSVYKDLAGTTAAALNWLASMGSGKSRYFNILGGMSVGSQFEQRYQTREATILASQFRNPPLEWKSGWSFGSPYYWGNFSMIKSRRVKDYLTEHPEYLYVYGPSSEQDRIFSVPSGCVWKYWMVEGNLSVDCPVVP
jgi:hypothetical protein